MFVRVKRVSPHEFLLIANNRRECKGVNRSVAGVLGWLGKLAASGAMTCASTARRSGCSRAVRGP